MKGTQFTSKINVRFESSTYSFVCIDFPTWCPFRPERYPGSDSRCCRWGRDDPPLSTPPSISTDRSWTGRGTRWDRAELWCVAVVKLSSAVQQFHPRSLPLKEKTMSHVSWWENSCLLDETSWITGTIICICHNQLLTAVGKRSPRSTTEGTGRKIGLEIEPISFNPTNVSALKKFTDCKYICMRRNSALSPSAGRYLHSLFPTSTVGHPGLFRFSLKRKKRTFTLHKTKQNKEKQRNVTQGNTKNIKSKCSCGRRG